jgi:hypothetical protein
LVSRSSQAKKLRALGAEHAGIARLHDQLFGRGFLGLDDAQHVTVGAPDQAAVKQGVSGFEAEQGQRRPLLPQLEERVQVVRLEQRAVAVQHQHVAFEVGQGRLGRQHRVAGAQGRVLDHHRLFAQARDHPFAHRRAVRAHHHHDAVAADALNGVDHPIQQRPATDLVQHLWDRRLHTRALACGHNHSGAGCHGASLRVDDVVIMRALAETANGFDGAFP